MRLTRTLSTNKSSAECVRGFRLPPTPTVHYRDTDSFVTALREQKNNTVLLDVDVMDAIDIDGTINGTNNEYRLTTSALGDLCKYTNIPAAYLRKTAEGNERLALDMVSDGISRGLRGCDSLVLVADGKSGLIHSIKSRSAVMNFSNLVVVDYLTSAQRGLSLSNGWLSGLRARMTLVDRDTPVEPRVGDIVHFGVNVNTWPSESVAARVSGYCERLVCINGMVRQSEHEGSEISADGWFLDDLHQAAVSGTAYNRNMPGLLKRSTDIVVDPRRAERISNWLLDRSNGGGLRFRDAVVTQAIAEAQQERRPSGDFTLWNLANGITAQAHGRADMDGRERIEAVGYNFLTAFCNN